MKTTKTNMVGETVYSGRAPKWLVRLASGFNRPVVYRHGHFMLLELKRRRALRAM